MTGFTREQLDALRRQIEEDYRMDIAAIDRLSRRFNGPAAVSAPASAPAPAYSPAPNGTPLGGPMVESTPPSPSMSAAPQEPQSDELAGSIRAMFASYRK